MRVGTVLHILGSLLTLLGVSLVFPLLVALFADDAHLPLAHYEVLSFVVTLACALVIGLSLRSVFDIDLHAIGHREGAAVVSLSWVLFSLVGALPFIITGSASFTDAVFETMSGFTTTGSSILADVSVLPKGIHLWRCLTQWIGGMGIVVLSVAVMPMLGAGGYRMFKAEAPGGSTYQRNAPRIKDTAKELWMTYSGLTALEIILLWVSGMSGFDSLCHGLATMSTGGFSTNPASLAGWPSAFTQWIVIIFMFLAGLNFDVHLDLLRGKSFSLKQNILWENIEVRVFILTVLTATALCTLLLWSGQHVRGGLETTVRAATFQVLTVTTSTGYGSQDFNLWPDILRLTLLLLMFMGGCAGSTAGGMKVIRILIFVKSAFVEVMRTINPHAVLVVRVGHRPLPRETVSNVITFITIWLFLFAFVTYLLTALGLDFLSATSASVASFANIGPGLASVGPTANYAHIPLVGKWLLIVAMLLGRLELYSVLALLSPRTWRR